MSKNAEELYDQKKFEIKDRKHREMRIAELEEQLNLVRNTNDHLSNELDKQTKQLDQIKGSKNDLVIGRIDRDEFVYEVMRIIQWRVKK